MTLLRQMIIQIQFCTYQLCMYCNCPLVKKIILFGISPICQYSFTVNPMTGMKIIGYMNVSSPFSEKFLNRVQPRIVPFLPVFRGHSKSSHTATNIPFLTHLEHPHLLQECLRDGTHLSSCLWLWENGACDIGDGRLLYCSTSQFLSYTNTWPKSKTTS